MNIGCSCCDGKTAVLGINTIWDTDRWMCDLGVSEKDAKRHVKTSNKRINVKCPHCSIDKTTRIVYIYGRKSISCKCGDGFSYGHKYIISFFTQLNIKYKDNFYPKWCNFYNIYTNKQTYGEYDFMLEDMKLIIEVDGSFHRKDNNMSGQTKEHSQFLDSEKDRLAIENGYEIIRIKYDCSIKEINKYIVSSKLTEMFNLECINWNKCEEFALSNRCKEVCELKRLNPDYTTKDIADIMGVGRSIILSYLKKGSLLKWCYYNEIEENLKAHSKKVEIFKDGVSKGVFESGYELSRVSENLIGFKLNKSKISSLCNERIKDYKGYTVKFL